MPRDTTLHSDRRRSDRERSRSPYREDHRRKHHRSRRTRSRSRSPHRDNEQRHHRHKRHRSRSPAPKPVELPYEAKPLSKRDFKTYKPIFESYLGIQKQLFIANLDEREIKGRWKSFVSRWNRGDLARSWYDPSLLEFARETVESFARNRRRHLEQTPPRRASPDYDTAAQKDTETQSNNDEEDDDFGPAPPRDIAQRHTGHGPTIPRFDDLALRDEQRSEDRAHSQSNYVDDIRHERRVDRKAQKERLEELVPRADPGSRERQLEKKRETTSTLKDFRDAKEGGDVEVGEAELMGDDSIEGYKRQKVEQERQKNERELRREEIARARAAEREERLADRRAKEAQTMDFLKQIAQERFG